jgi:hypothetical protein
MMKNRPSLSDAVDEISSYPRREDLHEFNQFIREKDMAGEAKEYVQDFLAGLPSTDISNDTLCGLLIGNVSTVYAVGKQRWEQARQLYSH